MHDVTLGLLPRTPGRIDRSTVVELVVDAIVLVVSMSVAGFIALHAIQAAAALLASHPG